MWWIDTTTKAVCRVEYSRDRLDCLCTNMVSGSSEPSTSRPRGYGTSSSTSPARRGKQREVIIDVDPSGDEGEQRINGHGSGHRKGKGRARDGCTAMSPAAAGLSVNVRFTDGTTEDLVDLFINDTETVRLVKRRVGFQQ